MSNQAAAEISSDVSTSPISAALENFHHLQIAYKIISSTPLFAHILVPKNTGSSSRPHGLLVRFHGGGLICGSAFTPLEWLDPWNFLWALKHDMLVVMPDYRLLPEADGQDLLDDLNQFWDWVGTGKFQRCLDEWTSSQKKVKVVIDSQKLYVIGGSAGGWFSTQSGFLAQSLGDSLNIKIRGVIAPYPMVDLEDPWYAENGYRLEEKFIGFSDMRHLVSDGNIKRIRDACPSAILSPEDAGAQERMNLMVAAFQAGSFPTFLKGNSGNVPAKYNPMQHLATAFEYPPLLILHGRQDGAVPYEHSERFAAALKKRVPGVHVRLELHEGDHGFDKGLDFKNGWLGEAIQWFEQNSGLREE